MFYQFDDEITTVESSEVNPNLITTAYFTKNDCKAVGVDSEIKNGFYVDAFESFTVVSLCHDNVVAKIKIESKNIIFVDFSGDKIIRDSFMKMLSRYSPVNISVAKLISAFFDEIITSETDEIEKFGFMITDLEEKVINNLTDSDFNFELLRMKKTLLLSLGFYKSFLSMLDLILENDNEVISEDIAYIEKVYARVERAKADINSLQGAVVHLQEAYSSYLDLKLNKTMKIFTVITTIFFPLTVITSWYGMNFVNMPELKWRYGYIIVIVISTLVVLSLFLIGKKKKWF